MFRVLIGGVLIAFGVGATPVQEVSVPTPASDVEQLRRQVAQLEDALALARALRGDCEATLAPLEAQARRADSDRRWADLKALMEQSRPGFECNPRTLACVKK